MSRILAIIASLLLCACCTAPAKPESKYSPEEAASCTVRVFSRAWSGTGVTMLNRPGSALTILTADHIVGHGGGPFLAQFEGGKPMPVVVTRKNTKMDLAVVMGMAPLAKGCEAAIGSPAKRGDMAWAVGYPMPTRPFSGLEMTHGNIRLVTVDITKRHFGTRVYVATTPVRNGMSGGGLWDAKGYLIGIASRGFKSDNSRSVFTHTDEIRSFLAGEKHEM